MSSWLGMDSYQNWTEPYGSLSFLGPPLTPKRAMEKPKIHKIYKESWRVGQVYPPTPEGGTQRVRETFIPLLPSVQVVSCTSTFQYCNDILILSMAGRVWDTLFFDLKVPPSLPPCTPPVVALKTNPSEEPLPTDSLVACWVPRRVFSSKWYPNKVPKR